MDVNRYSFQCKKAFHDGMRLAKSFGHELVEVEHVAFALMESVRVVAIGHAEIYRSTLLRHLKLWPKTFGRVEIKFGRRIGLCCKALEAQSGEIDGDALWEGLVRQSSVLKKASLTLEQEKKRGDEFNPWDPEEQKLGSLGAASQATPEKKKLPKKLDDTLKNYTIDLTEKASLGQLDPVIGRDPIARRVFEILARKKKNNPLLLGPPGVGKTAIAELMAQKIVGGMAPEIFLGTRILNLDLAALLAGTKFRGEFEERLKDLLEALRLTEGQVILFIDEIHTLIGAGNSEGGADGANLLKPALARGEIHCIGATTTTEFRKYFAKDTALERRFQPVQVDEPNEDTALAILRGLKGRYERFHKIEIEDSAVESAVRLSQRFLPDRKLPDKAIDLIDEACSRVRMSLATMPRELAMLKERIDQLEVERQAMRQAATKGKSLVRLEVELEKLKKDFQKLSSVIARFHHLKQNLNQVESDLEALTDLEKQVKGAGDYGLAANLNYVEIPKAQSDLNGAFLELDNLLINYPFLHQSVDARVIRTILSEWTGIPIEDLNTTKRERLLSMGERLNQQIFGQPEAIDAIHRALRRSMVGIASEFRPRGVFLFVGPTGVGKTETAKALAEELFGSKSAMIRFDMSEYGEAHQVARWIGAPPGYVGYAEGGELTEALRRKPFSVLLLDEIEKAHPKIFDTLLQAFDEGRITDSQGGVANLRECIIIMTSNLPVWREGQDPDDRRDERARESLAPYFRPEFINRIDEVIPFQPLGRRHFDRLLDQLLLELNQKLESRGLRIILGPSMRKHLVDRGLKSPYGGRGLRRNFERDVVDQVSEKWLDEGDQWQGAWVLHYASGNKAIWQVEDGQGKYLPMPSSS